MEPLTERERDVLKLMALGKSVEDVAIVLGLHRETVRMLVRQATGKLNAARGP